MDLYLTEFFNGFAGQSVIFDLFIDFVQESYLVKGLFAVCVLVMVYTSRQGNDLERQNNVYTTLILVFAALFLGRILQMTLPFSPRPLHTDGLGLTLVAGVKETALKHDSSFPSDHAVMFMTIAGSVLLYHRLAGLVLLCHAIFVICLPRILLGFHWPSDILAGAAIGLLIPVIFHRPVARLLRRTRLSEFQAKHPSIFYAIFFVLLSETATMYQGSRHMLSEIADLAHRVM